MPKVLPWSAGAVNEAFDMVDAAVRAGVHGENPDVEDGGREALSLLACLVAALVIEEAVPDPEGWAREVRARFLRRAEVGVAVED